MKNFNIKLILTLSFAILFYSNLFGQNNTGYLTALKYIADDNHGKRILVSDTIIHLDFSNFWDRIDSLHAGKREALVRSLDSLDHARENQQFVLKEFKGVKFDGNGPTYVMFFSDFYEGMVIGEIMPQKNKKHPFMHNAQASFNEATQYLFIFDKKYKLKQVFKGRIAYD
jgi:hypothetical protein